MLINWDYAKEAVETICLITKPESPTETVLMGTTLTQVQQLFRDYENSINVGRSLPESSSINVAAKFSH